MTDESKRLPRGVRQHNPLNVRPGDPWEGLADPPEDGGFCVFINNVFGFRAAARILIRYYDVYKLVTVKDIVTRWAPPADNNNTQAYIAAVCNRTGWLADEVIAPKSYEDCWKLLRAMTIQEQGSFDQFFKKWELDDGLRRAGIVDVPVTPLKKNVAAVGASITAATTVIQPTYEAYANSKPFLDVLINNVGSIAILVLAIIVIGYEYVKLKRG